MNETIEIVSTSDVAVGGVWPHEEHNFTPWLAAHLEYLDMLGMGSLTWKGTEVSVAGKSLDILAERVVDGRLVVIENQYGKADDDHLRRGLEYALAKEAVALILIAQQFPPHFISDTLPKRGDLPGADSMPVFLVTLRVEELTGKDLPYRIPRLDVVEPRTIDWPPACPPIPPPITLPQFLGATTASVRPAVKALFDTWQELPGSDVAPKPGNTKMGLWIAVGTDRPEMVMDVENPLGRLWINRGAIRRYRSSIGSFEDTQVDEALQRWFPSATRGLDFPSVDSPAPASVKGFGLWLVEERAGP